jgi:hypothetical protein
LLADSGMLQPQHRVRRENEPWHQAVAVIGLFSPATPMGGIPAASASPRVAAAHNPIEELPFGEWSPPAADDSVPAGVFDFFAENGSPAPPPPKPPPKPAKSVKPASIRKPVEPQKQAPVPNIAEKPVRELALPPPETPAAAALIDSNIPEAIAEIADEGTNPFAFEPLPTAPGGVGSKTDETKLTATPRPTASPPEPPFPLQPEAAPVPESPPVHQPTSQNSPVPAASHAAMPEISGNPVDLLPDFSIRLNEGRTTFRLHRAWLLAVTKYSDGTSRVSYLRLPRIDAGVIEQRHEAGRGKYGPHSVLVFHVGDHSEALAFEGSDKPYRAFIEKVLLHGSPPKPSQPQRS